MKYGIDWDLNMPDDQIAIYRRKYVFGNSSALCMSDNLQFFWKTDYQPVGWRITEVLEYECETLETFEMRLVRQITALSYGAKCTNFDNR